MTTADHLIHQFFVVAGLRRNSIHLPEGILTASNMAQSEQHSAEGRTALKHAEFMS
jgi:hypothetical protein